MMKSRRAKLMRRNGFALKTESRTGEKCRYISGDATCLRQHPPHLGRRLVGPLCAKNSRQIVGCAPPKTKYANS